MKEIRKIGLDFDGVIVNSNRGFTDEFNTIGENLTGRKTLAEDIFATWGVTLLELLEKFYPEVNLSIYLQERERLGFHRNFPALIPGAVEAIERLSAKIPISIVTNRESRTLFEILEARRVDIRLFEKIQSSDDTNYDKPDPRVFDDLLVRYRARETAYVGDHHVADYRAASGAGIHFIGVLSGGISTREDFLEAGLAENRIFESLAYLPDLFGL